MKGSFPAPGPRHAALMELLRTAEALWNASRVFFARWDLSPSQFNVLNLLYGTPEGCSQVELSRELIMHRSNVTGLVDRLEGRGLVRREAQANDRRVFKVTLTAAGKQQMRQIQPHYYQAAEAAWGEMPVERAQELVAELQAVSRNAARIAGNGDVDGDKKRGKQHERGKDIRG